jgi:hypothetical protein
VEAGKVLLAADHGYGTVLGAQDFELAAFIPGVGRAQPREEQLRVEALQNRGVFAAGRDELLQMAALEGAACVGGVVLGEEVGESFLELGQELGPEGFAEIGREIGQRGWGNSGVTSGPVEGAPIGQPEAEERFGFLEGPILVREGVGGVEERVEFRGDYSGQESEGLIQSRIEERFPGVE